MYYTAGSDPNTASQGGVGIAFSNDGINWTRWNGNPLRTFIGGHTFAVQNLRIDGKHYLYFSGGGGTTTAPDLRVLQDVGGGTTLSPDKVLRLGGNVYPLFFDTSSASCWLS